MSEFDTLEFMRSYLASWRSARPDLDFEALELISWTGQMVREFESRVEDLAAASGLKIGEVSVLLALRRAPGHSASPTQLSHDLWVTSGGMTYRVDRLVERGLARRTYNPDDRRSFNVELNEEGLILADRIQTRINAMETLAVASLDEDERAVLTALMKKMLAGFVGRSRGGDPTAT